MKINFENNWYLYKIEIYNSINIRLKSVYIFCRLS